MIKKDNQVLEIIILLFVAILLIFLINPDTVLAVPDESAIYNSAPEGLPVKDYFSINNPLRPAAADVYYPFMNNSASIDTTNPNILVLARGSSRNGNNDVNDGVYGAAWSKMDKANYIDITKKQTVSVWLYFGNGQDTDMTTNGEGMTLTLQNDPRKNNAGQSQALGAGYQSLGALGYDRSTVSYSTFGSFGKGQLPSPDYLANTAVKNIVALDFDTDHNDTMTGGGLNISKNGPLTILKTKNAEWFGTVSGITEYSLGGFDTTDTLHSGSSEISKDFPGYDEILKQKPGNKLPLRQGNNGGAGYGVISSTYPGNPLTYQLGELLQTTKDYKRFQTGPYGAMTTVQVYGTSATLVDGSDAHNNSIYWHHLTFTWNPARNANGTPTKNGLPVAGGTYPSINYKFNDKMPDGSTNTANTTYYSKVTDSIPVDASQFNLTGGNTKVYWGLTGANSNNSDVYSKMAIFESIPALSTATVNSTVIDNDLIGNDGKKQIITDSKDTTTVPNSTVFNKNKLTFNYNLKFDPDSSHQNWQNIVAKINLPVTNVAFSENGSITYHTNAGQPDDKTEVTTIPLAWSTTNPSELQYKLAYSLGSIVNDPNNPNKYTSADINFNGTAQNNTNSAITVNPKPATFSGSNALESTSSPLFKIENDIEDKKNLQLEVSNYLQFKNINYKVTQPFIARTTPFVLNVISLKTPWTLNVSSKGLFLNGKGQKFNGDIIYKKTTNDLPLIINSTFQEIAEDPATPSVSTTTYLAKDWQRNTGLLLKPTSYDNQAGQYTGELDWELTDAVQNK